VNELVVQLKAFTTGLACADNCRPNVFETPFALAVKVAVTLVVTAATVAVNAALVAPAGTVTAPGTTTEGLLLERLTARPPVGAAELSVTVHASVPAPVNELAVQLKAFTTGLACADSCRPNVFETPPALAVKVADPLVVTAATVAVNATLVAPADTVTEPGTTTEGLLLERLATKPPVGAAELSVTVQASVPAVE
jgi:hypothetical protein